MRRKLKFNNWNIQSLKKNKRRVAIGLNVVLSLTIDDDLIKSSS